MSAIVHQGDCRDVMATLAEGSVSSVVCDPPYGLKFMGKGWDHGVPGVEFWTAALRVAAPGARLLAFGGTRTYHRLTCAIEDAGWRIEDCLSWLYGSGFPKHKSKLKPAWEPVILAHKPAKRAVPLNIDACRLATDEGLGRLNHTTSRYIDSANGSRESHPRTILVNNSGNLGRWPANVLLDEEAAAALDEQSGTTTSSAAIRYNSAGAMGYGGSSRDFIGLGYTDTGGASRFYYTAKASRAERGEGNTHPTVKPIALMRWLCRLITPECGVVLDPFCGSGTTGCAAVTEGFDFIGIDEEPEYVAIAEKRIRHWTEKAQLSLMGVA